MRAAWRRATATLALAAAAWALAPRPADPAAGGAAAPPAPAWLLLRRDADPHLARRMARVHLDDRALTALAGGEQQRIALTPGRHRLAVDLWDQPGHCEIAVELAGGETLALRVVPRRAAPAGPRCDGAFHFAAAGPGT